MQPKFIVANWKMHTTSHVSRDLALRVVEGLGEPKGVIVALCPPFLYLAVVADVVRGSKVALGAQNLYPEDEGAFTGEVSPEMLLDVGCRYVILGHSERRRILGEKDAFINQKVKKALSVDLDVILCIGETLEQRQSNQTIAVLDRQMNLGLADLPSDRLRRLTIAYEPIWAIGNGNEATSKEIHYAHAAIRDCFFRLFGPEAARSLRILYGGSVRPENSPSILDTPGVDGALVGGASLHADSFLAIIHGNSF